MCIIKRELDEPSSVDFAIFDIQIESLFQPQIEHLFRSRNCNRCIQFSYVQIGVYRYYTGVMLNNFPLRT